MTQVTGSVRLERHYRRLEVGPGTLLMPGDTVKTGRDGRADISITGKTGVRLLANTVCEILEASKEKTRLGFTAGNILIKLSKLPEEHLFEMKTPVAVVGVRGTQFWGRVEYPVEEQAASTLAVRQGTISVRVKRTDETFEVKENEALDIPLKTPPKVRPALPKELAAIAQLDDVKILP